MRMEPRQWGLGGPTSPPDPHPRRHTTLRSKTKTPNPRHTFNQSQGGENKLQDDVIRENADTQTGLEGKKPRNNLEGGGLFCDL